jgi:RNA polymerase sigma-70 factor (ECF subfamily)
VGDAQQVMPADRELIVAMAAGDSRALHNLNARYGRMLAALARRFLNNESDSEEVVADVLWQAWRDAKTFDSTRGSVSVWLVTLARSRAIDRLRTNRARKPPPGEQPASEPVRDPAFDIHQVERARIVRTALAGLEMPRPPTGRQELARKLLAGILACYEVLLLQDPVVDGFDVEAPVTADVKGRNLIVPHQPVDRAWMHVQVS